MKHRFNDAFYSSQEWIKTREAFASYKGGLCERCLKKGIVQAGEIVHHKIYLTPSNINDPTITLNWDNLELLCRRCHAEEHTRRRYSIDACGKVLTR